MNPLVHDLVSFVNQQKADGALASAVDHVGHTAARIAVIKVLLWIKEQARGRTTKALRLAPKYPWCQDLQTIFSQIPEFRELFTVDSSQLDFSNTLAQEDRLALISYVDDNYQVRLRI
jgi:hypothetical protein